MDMCYALHIRSRSDIDKMFADKTMTFAIFSNDPYREKPLHFVETPFIVVWAALAVKVLGSAFAGDVCIIGHYDAIAQRSHFF